MWLVCAALARGSPHWRPSKTSRAHVLRGTLMTSPGWYSDSSASGTERYWDGSQWTEQTRPAAPQPFGAAPPAALGTPGKKSWFLRHKILTGIGAVLLIGIIASAAGGGGTDLENASGDNGDDAPVASETQIPAAQASKPAANKPAASKPAGPTIDYAGKQKGDTAVKPGGSVSLSGWTTTISALKRKSEQYTGEYLCADVLMVNRDDETQATGAITMQAPNGQVEDATFFGAGEDRYDSYQDIAPGGKVQSIVCFDYKKSFGTGQFLVAWQPDTFSSKDRGVWVNTI